MPGRQTIIMRRIIIVLGLGCAVIAALLGYRVLVSGASSDQRLPQPFTAVNTGGSPGTPQPARLPTMTAVPLTATATATVQARVAPSNSKLINGVPIEQIIVMSDAARQNVREILAKAQARGRNLHAFAKIGDSTMVWPPLLAVFDNKGAYKLGDYASLQPAVDYYAGFFARDSIATKRGMHSWSAFDATWSDPILCLAGEGPLACEIRVSNPSVALIRLGANDSDAPDEFDPAMRRIIEYCLANAVVPVVGTKPDQSEGSQNTINYVVRALALQYKIPLWDYELVAKTVPNRGLEDAVHMQLGDTHDFTLAKAFQEGDPLEDLTALMMLDAVRQAK
jgi:hypothetical protein